LTAYDDIHYTSFPYQHSHPDHLGLIGELFGMQPAPVATCRVLEIGCALGGNLIPMAEAFPRARFLGIDLAATQIAEAQATAHALGLANLELRALDILDIPEDLGRFDYLICHGVFSWVPPPVRARLLDVCGRHLAPHGIAYVSHNVKPGYYLRNVVREMMRYHVRNTADPARRVEQARALVDFLTDAARDDRWRAVLEGEQINVRQAADWLIYHDQLAEVNEGIWFHELAAELPARGLAFLADADLATMLPLGYPDDVKQTLDRVAPDLLRHQQYLDFVRNRTFRMTLLCRADVPLVRDLDAAQLERYHLSSRATASADKPEREGGEPVITFHTPTGAQAKIGKSIVQNALAQLATAWPRSLPFPELVRAAGAEPGSEPARTLANDLFQCFVAGVVYLAREPSRCVAEVSPRPRATAWARLQAERGPFVTTLLHENGKLDLHTRRVLALLDGSHDHAALAAALRQGDEVQHTSIDDILRRLAIMGYLCG
jgi:SAM-dependent methyltransferase